jgi:GTP pyrophosphokinase
MPAYGCNKFATVLTSGTRGVYSECGKGESVSEKVAVAVEFARKAHEGHKRKGTPEPYISHPIEVMEMVARYGASEAVQMAAVLHDTVEDTGVKPEELARLFGEEAAALVMELTEPYGSPRPAYEFRKAAYLVAMKGASPGAALVAASDKLSNAKSILALSVEMGPAVFELFKKKREGTLKFYREVTEVLKPKVPVGLAAELEEAVSKMEAL